MNTIKLEIGLTLLFVVFICFLSAIASAIKCSASWKDSGMQAKWSVVSGCRVEVSPGKWIPSDKVREINP